MIIYCKSFPLIIIFISHNVLSLSSLYKWENWGIKRLRNLPKGLGASLTTIKAFIFSVQLTLLHFSWETNEINTVWLVFCSKVTLKSVSFLEGRGFIFIIVSRVSKVCEFSVEGKISSEKVKKKKVCGFKIITVNYRDLSIEFASNEKNGVICCHHCHLFIPQE